MWRFTRAYCGSAPFAETSAIQSPWMSAAVLRPAATNRIQIVFFILLFLPKTDVVREITRYLGQRDPIPHLAAWRVRLTRRDAGQFRSADVTGSQRSITAKS